MFHLKTQIPEKILSFPGICIFAYQKFVRLHQKLFQFFTTFVNIQKIRESIRFYVDIKKMTFSK